MTCGLYIWFKHSPTITPPQNFIFIASFTCGSLQAEGLFFLQKLFYINQHPLCIFCKSQLQYIVDTQQKVDNQLLLELDFFFLLLHIPSIMPKYKGKQQFSFLTFPDFSWVKSNEQKKERKMSLKTMYSFACNCHHWWRMQATWTNGQFIVHSFH